jgi:hypothetical protein
MIVFLFCLDKLNYPLNHIRRNFLNLATFGNIENKDVLSARYSCW